MMIIKFNLTFNTFLDAFISQGLHGHEGPLGQPGIPGCNGTKVEMMAWQKADRIIFFSLISRVLYSSLPVLADV